jgi:pimeloyl-ACP methyl ester carboxylesterase
MRLVFVHGFLGSSLNWGPVITKLGSNSWIKSNNVSLESYDLLGHGAKSQKGSSLLTVEELGMDLFADIQNSQKSDGPLVVVGHSFGVRPLLWILERYPNFAKGFVVEDSSPVVSDQGFAELSRIFAEIRPPFESRQAAKEGIEKVFGLNSKMSRFLMTGIRENSAGQFDWRFSAAALKNLLTTAYQNPQWEAWENYKGPIAMIMGQDSAFVSADRQEECLNRRGNLDTQIYQVANAGHWVHSDKVDDFCDLLVKVVSKWITDLKS